MDIAVNCGRSVTLAVVARHVKAGPRLFAVCRVAMACKGQEVHVREEVNMRLKGFGALGLSAIVIGLLPGSALAAKATVTTGAAANVTFQSARVGGSVDPNKTATNYYFQYGSTVALGTNTAQIPAGAGNKAVRVSVDLGGLAPATTYHYRIVAQNASGTTLGKRRTFKTRKQPLGVSLAASPNPIKFGTGTTLAGTLSGTGNAGRKIVLQSNPWPYSQGFQNASNELLTNATGGFSFAILSLPFNTQYRVVMSERPAVVSPIVTAGVKFYVGSKVNKKHVRRGKKVRFSGTIQPAKPGANIAFQKKSHGRWVSINGTLVRGGGKYSKSIKIKRGGSYRVWTGDVFGQYTSNHGKTFHLHTFR
jgi:hypothetical protein